MDDSTDNGGRRRALGALFAAGLAAGAATRAPAQPVATRPASAEAADARVDQLWARSAIEEVLMAYARGNDRNDIDLIRSCFWPESTHHHGGFSGSSQDFVTFAGGIIGKLKHCAHFITNVSVRVNGNRAFSECYYFAHHRRDAASGGEEDAFFEGRYLDFHEQRNGIWKIIRRRGLSDLVLVTPAKTPYADWPAGQHSLHDRGDDYYRMLAEFEGRA